MASFDLAFPIIQKEEGGYQDRYSDPGNWTSGHIGIGELKGTNVGISASAYPNEDIKNLTLDKIKQIYKSDWWKFDDIKDQAVANKVFSLAVNWQRYGGHGPAIAVLQQAINDVDYVFGVISVDGHFGPTTIAGCNICDPVKLLNAIRQRALARYKLIEAAHPEEYMFFKGWEVRALS